MASKGDKPLKASPNKKYETTRYLSPLPRDPGLDTKNSSPRLVPAKRATNDPSPKMPQKPVKHVTDAALDASLILNNNNTLEALDALSLDTDFGPLPPLHDTSRKNNDILDHKKHIEEIEAKMSKCMQISVASTSSVTTSRRESIGKETNNNKVLVQQSSDEAVFEVLMKEQQMDLERMKYQLKESTMKHEYFLDQMCDEMTQESPQKISNKGSQDTELPVKKKKSIDSAKKNKLLAALKAIDGNDSFEKS